MTLGRLLVAVARRAPDAAARSAAQPGRILVMPFENARREPQLHWIGEAARLLLADDLNARGVSPPSGGPSAYAPSSSCTCRSPRVLSRATVIKVGELVGASEVIVGRVSLDRRAARRSKRTASGSTSAALQPDVRERGPLGDVVAIFERVASRFAPDARPGRRPTARPPLEAFESYVKGLMAEKAAATRATFLEEAIKPTPSTMPRYLALWDVRNTRGTTPPPWRPRGRYGQVRRSCDAPAFSRRVSLLELKRFDEAYDAFKRLTASGAEMACGRRVQQPRHRAAAPGAPLRRRACPPIS